MASFNWKLLVAVPPGGLGGGRGRGRGRKKRFRLQSEILEFFFTPPLSPPSSDISEGGSDVSAISGRRALIGGWDYANELREEEPELLPIWIEGHGERKTVIGDAGVVQWRRRGGENLNGAVPILHKWTGCSEKRRKGGRESKEEISSAHRRRRRTSTNLSFEKGGRRRRCGLAGGGDARDVIRPPPIDRQRDDADDANSATPLWRTRRLADLPFFFPSL